MRARVLLQAIVLSVFAGVAVAGPASAQTRPAPASRSAASSDLPLVFVSINVGGLATSNDFTDSASYPSPYPTTGEEKVTFTTDYKVPAGLAIDIGGGVRVWRNLAAAVAVTQYNSTQDAAVSGEYPHPFFFNKPRPFSGTASGLDRSDTAVHVDAAWMVPVNRHLMVIAFGGPSFFSVQQDVVTSVRVTETYPYDETTFQDVGRSTAKESAVGFNVGADVMYRLTRNIGVGGVARFTQASVDITTAGTSTRSIDAGGFIVSGGLRVTF